jgi:luciferase family oxidoreductase group 1
VSSLSGVPLSVLDTSPIVQGSTAAVALRNTVGLAQLADRLGYHRYWVPEHHSMRGVASAAPAVVVGQIAASTRTIRVGAGGVLLANHAPLVVAEQFGTLEAFHPGRIDLGIGRALGGPKLAAAAVRSATERTASSFAEQLSELIGYFDPALDRPVQAIPAVGNAPPVWLLGSSDFSAKLAGSLGLPYAFAYHLRPDGIGSALRLYRDSFRASDIRPEPYALVSVPVIVAETDEHARWLAGPNRLKVFSRGLGSRILLPTPQEADGYRYTPEDLVQLEERFASEIVGSPSTVHKRLGQLLDEYAMDELMVSTKVYDEADRRRSYELLAGLAG